MFDEQNNTPVRQMEEQLRVSEQKYRLLTEQVSDIICQLNPEGTIDFISSSAGRILGVGPGRLIGLNFRTLLLKDDQATFGRFLDAAQREDESALCNLRALNGKCEVIWLELSGRAPRDSSGAFRGIVCTARDITKRKKVELELREARQQAENANAAKSRFLSHITHDLRTPLNAIMGYSDLIREQTFGPVGNRHYTEYAKLIHDSGGLLAALVNDLLDLSKIESGKYELHLESLDLKDIVPFCIAQITPQATEKRITIGDRVSGANVKLQADKRALSRVLINLLSNAVKFTPGGGRIELTARSEEHHLRLSIHDTGIGINKEDVDRITEPFEQASNDPRMTPQGTGLGLNLVKSLVEQHGGELIIESEPGEGTTVSVVLPTDIHYEAAA